MGRVLLHYLLHQRLLSSCWIRAVYFGLWLDLVCDVTQSTDLCFTGQSAWLFGWDWWWSLYGLDAVGRSHLCIILVGLKLWVRGEAALHANCLHHWTALTSDEF